MDKYIFFSFLEMLYIFYMMNIFKTKYSVHHPFEYIMGIHNFIKHPINTGNYESKICFLGNIIGIILPVWILIRII